MPAPPKRNPSPRQQRSRQSSAQTARRASHSAHAHTPQVVDPRWLLKALATVFAVALLFSWGTLCLLWYQGQWQLVLHPSRTVTNSPNQAQLAYTDVHFFDDRTGQAQLNGWVMPSVATTAAHTEMLRAPDPHSPTVLFLHGADGDMSNSLPRALTLHNAHLNVFLFDYRGYGSSTGQHPTQATMQQDAEAALTYLTGLQGVKPSSVIVYGEGLGASLAVNLAARHQDIPAIILESPDGDLTGRVLRDAHSWLIPVHLLFHEDFPLAAPLHTLSTAKLLITYRTTAPAALANAADPKITVELPSPGDPKFLPAVERFVDEYVHAP